MDAGLIKLIIVVVLVAIGWFRGRRNERAHLAELAAREASLREVLLFATRYPPMHLGTLDPCLVSGSAVVAADHFKMFVAGLRKFVGGRFEAYEILIERARREALLRMKEQARAAGCSMVFNVRVETTNITAGGQGATSIEVLAYGTAFAPARGSVAQSAFTYLPGPEVATPEPFDLLKNPASRALLAGCGLLVIWSAVENLLLDGYFYAHGAPWSALLLIALVAAGVGIAYMRRKGVPTGHAVGVGLLLGLLLPVLLYLPALRVNALTDFSPALEHRYLLQPDRTTLIPDDPRLPRLEESDNRWYWKNQQPGSEHLFVMRRGVLGFWQFERQPYLRRLDTAWGRRQ